MLRKFKEKFLGPEWELQYKRQVSLKEEIQKRKISLKFDRSHVIVSDIGTQFYNELQLEASYLQGRIETQARQIGSEGHEKIIEEEPRVSSQEIWRKIYTYIRKIFCFGNIVYCKV